MNSPGAPSPDGQPTEQASGSELMTARQVGKLFLRSDRTIRSWIQRGHIHPVRVGRSVYFRRDEINRLLGLEDAE